MNKKEISYRICTAVIESGLSNKEAARRAGIPPTTLYNYLKGGMPSAEKLAALCGALGVSADWVLGLRKDMELNE